MGRSMCVALAIAGCGSKPQMIPPSDQAPQIATFTATPSAIAAGAATDVTFAWTYANAPSPTPDCTIDPDVGAIAMDAPANITIGPLGLTRDYTLTCTNAAGSATATTTITAYCGQG